MQLEGQKGREEEGADIILQKTNGQNFSKVYENYIHKFKKLMKLQTEEI